MNFHTSAVFYSADILMLKNAGVEVNITDFVCAMLFKDYQFSLCLLAQQFDFSKRLLFLDNFISQADDSAGRLMVMTDCWPHSKVLKTLHSGSS